MKIHYNKTVYDNTLNEMLCFLNVTVFSVCFCCCVLLSCFDIQGPRYTLHNNTLQYSLCTVLYSYHTSPK